MHHGSNDQRPLHWPRVSEPLLAAPSVPPIPTPSPSASGSGSGSERVAPVLRVPAALRGPQLFPSSTFVTAAASPATTTTPPTIAATAAATSSNVAMYMLRSERVGCGAPHIALSASVEQLDASGYIESSRSPSSSSSSSSSSSTSTATLSDSRWHSAPRKVTSSSTDDDDGATASSVVRNDADELSSTSLDDSSVASSSPSSSRQRQQLGADSSVEWNVRFRQLLSDVQAEDASKLGAVLNELRLSGSTASSLSDTDELGASSLLTSTALLTPTSALPPITMTKAVPSPPPPPLTSAPSGGVAGAALAAAYLDDQELSSTALNVRLHKYTQLKNLARDFVFQSLEYGTIIISEMHLPPAAQTIKRLAIGGVAGGDKYLCKGTTTTTQPTRSHSLAHTNE